MTKNIKEVGQSLSSLNIETSRFLAITVRNGMHNQEGRR
jgi:hypothetical protein